MAPRRATSSPELQKRSWLSLLSVLGPASPYPGALGTTMPYFTWNGKLCYHKCVTRVSRIVGIFGLLCAVAPVFGLVPWYAFNISDPVFTSITLLAPFLGAVLALVILIANKDDSVTRYLSLVTLALAALYPIFMFQLLRGAFSF